MASRNALTRPSRGRGTGDDGVGPGRQVNSLLHTLRGEQFRHQQNLLRSKSHAISSLESTPSLPLAQIFGTDPVDADVEPVQPAPFREPGQPGHRGARPPVTLVEGVPTYAYPNGAVPGPKPPRSWTPLFDGEEKYGPAWRAEALAVVLRDLAVPEWALDEESVVLPLPLECARVLLEAYEDPEDVAAIALYLPALVRRDLMRWCAVRKPLSSSRLYALCGPEGHAGGELLVVGPHASLRSEVLKRAQEHKGPQEASGFGPGDEEPGAGGLREQEEEWDRPADLPPTLTTIALLATPLTSSVLTALPPTLTHLALISLPQAARIYRLPQSCPLLEILDLSFNTWLVAKDGQGVGSSEGALERVTWRRWSHLRILGLRGCGVSDAIARKVNEGRWTDVQIIGLDSGQPNVPSSVARNRP